MFLMIENSSLVRRKVELDREQQQSPLCSPIFTMSFSLCLPNYSFEALFFDLPDIYFDAAILKIYSISSFFPSPCLKHYNNQPYAQYAKLLGATYHETVMYSAYVHTLLYNQPHLVYAILNQVLMNRNLAI